MFQVGRVLGGGHEVRASRLDHECDRLRIDQRMPDARHLVAHAERDTDRADLRNRVEQDDEGRAIAQKHRDPVAFLHAPRGEAPGNAGNLCIKRGVGQAEIPENQRFVVGVLCDGLFQHAVQVGRPVRVAGHDAAAVMQFAPQGRSEAHAPSFLLLS